MNENEQVVVKSRDLNLNSIYTYVFTREDAVNIIDNEDEFMIDISSGKIYFREKTIEIRTTAGGGLGIFDKKDIINQIKDQL